MLASDPSGAASESPSEQQQLLRSLVESVSDYAIFMLSPSGHIASWNPGAARIKGYRAAEIIGRHFSVFYPAVDVAAGKCELELEGALRDGRFEDDGWRIRKDGTRFWANVVISTMRDRSGKVLGFSKVTRDLTERKNAEQANAARLAAEERFRLLVDSVRDYAIFMLDPDGTVATWNLGAERIKGYAAAEIIGKHFSTFYTDEERRAGKCEHELTVAHREGSYEDEGWRVRKDGSRFWASVVITAIWNHAHELVGFAKVTRDLTERRRANEQAAARAAAEQANRAKDEFLAMLGHELRNPLAPIVTALQLMKLRSGHHASPEQEIIERQVKHMVHLVDDLLDVSRIARGKVAIKRARIDLRDVLAKAIEVASPLLEQRHHHLAIDAPPGALVVDADEARLIQIFANLLTNAAKYTDTDGNIAVTVRLLDSTVEIAITDSGLGIEPALLPHVFDLFMQAQQSADRSAGGLGLGLTLVKSLVHLHHGTVTAHSGGRGTGSTFTVRLPLLAAIDEAPAAPAPTPPIRAARPRRVLVVDDNEDACLLLAEALLTLGHTVETAFDPAAALRIAPGFAPDVIVLDIGLPVMDGYQLAERLRATLGDKTPRLIALTGYGQQTDRARSQAAGFAVHLVKPVDLGLLVESITAD